MTFTRSLVIQKNLKSDILVVSGFLAFALTLFLALPIHEFGHYLFAKMVGINGYSVVYWSSFRGMFLFVSSLGDWRVGFILLGGGLFQALIIFGLWLAMPLKRVWYISALYGVVFSIFLSYGLWEFLK